MGNNGWRSLELSGNDALRAVPVLFVSSEEDDRVASNTMTEEAAMVHISIIEHGTLTIAEKVARWIETNAKV